MTAAIYLTMSRLNKDDAASSQRQQQLQLQDQLTRAYLNYINLLPKALNSAENIDTTLGAIAQLQLLKQILPTSPIDILAQATQLPFYRTQTEGTSLAASTHLDLIANAVTGEGFKGSTGFNLPPPSLLPIPLGFPENKNLPHFSSSSSDDTYTSIDSSSRPRKIPTAGSKRRREDIGSLSLAKRELSIQSLDRTCSEDSIGSDTTLEQGKKKRSRQQSSKYRGVSRCKKDGRYQARIRVGSSVKYLGRFKTETEAAMCYDVAAVHYHGCKAVLNFPAQGNSVNKTKNTCTDA